MVDDATMPLPNLSHRVSIMGRTGSGKTQFGTWLLSLAPFDRQPFVIVDYKRETLFAQLDRIREIALNEIPKHPGLYVIRPRAGHDGDAEQVEAWLWKVLERTKVGLYFDEAYMVPDKGAFAGVLTQGRSLHIPVISLTQRPAWISRFVFSEADFFGVFHLNDKDDRLKVKRFLPNEHDIEEMLPEFNSTWYHVVKHQLFRLLPVPDAATILDTIEARLAPRRRTI